MSNPSTDLQKDENKDTSQPKPGNIATSATAELIKVGGSAVTLISGVVAVIAWFYSLSPLLFIPLMAVLFFLAFYFLFVPKLKRLEAENQSLKETQDTTGLDAEKIILEAEKHVALGSADEYEKKLQEYDWLLKIEKEDSENIDKRVDVQKVEYSDHDFEGHPHLVIVFAITVFNKSVFSVTFENRISGKLLFDKKPFDEKIQFHEPPPVIKRNETGTIRIEQRLNDSEVAALKRVMERFEEQCKNNTSRGVPIPTEIDFSNLVITVKGADKFPQILPNKLDMFYVKKFEVTRRNFNLQSSQIKNPEVIELENKIDRILSEHDRALKERDAYIDKIDFLIEPVLNQRENIDKFVVLEKIFFRGVDTRTVPMLHFTLQIRNYSFFDVEIVNELDGFIYLKVPEGGVLSLTPLKFQGMKFFSDNREIPATKTAQVDFTQRLLDGDLGYIERWKQNREDLRENFENYFVMDKLEIRIKGVNDIWKVEEKKLHIPKNAYPIDMEKYYFETGRFEYEESN